MSAAPKKSLRKQAMLIEPEALIAFVRGSYPGNSFTRF